MTLTIDILSKLIWVIPIAALAYGVFELWQIVVEAIYQVVGIF